MRLAGFAALSLIAAGSFLISGAAQADSQCGNQPCRGGRVVATLVKPFTGHMGSWYVARYGCDSCIEKQGLLGDRATLTLVAGRRYCFCKNGTRWVTPPVYAGGTFQFRDTGERCETKVRVY